MADDLGTPSGEVHVQSGAVLAFWFDQLTPQQRFAKDDAIDATIAERFGGLRDAVAASGAAGWRHVPETLLAAIILLDQFTRNLNRDSGEAFAADPLALSLAREAVARRFDAAIPAERRSFVYMPFMHAEDRAAQAEGLALFKALGDDTSLKFAKSHAAVIERFGRFPHRNDALGRASSAAETEYLSRPDAGW